MRRYLTAAAFAAIAFASAPAAAIEINPAEIAWHCPQMSHGEIVSKETRQKISDIIENYELDQKPEVAKEQIAMVLCGDEPGPQPAAGQPKVEQAMMMPPITLQLGGSGAQKKRRPPPPHFRGPHPRFHGGPPPRRYYGGHQPRRFTAPRPMRRVVRVPRAPYYGAAAGAVGGYAVREEVRTLTKKSVQGPPYCVAVRDGEKAFAEKYPMPQGYPPGACTIGEIPGKPCPGWVCSRGG